MSWSSLLLPPLSDVPPSMVGNPTRHLYSCDNSTSGLSHIPGFPKTRTFSPSHHTPPASTFLGRTLTRGCHIPVGGCWRKGALGLGPGLQGTAAQGAPVLPPQKSFWVILVWSLSSNTNTVRVWTMTLTSRRLSFGVTSGRLRPWIEGHISPSGSPLCESLLSSSDSGAFPYPFSLNKGGGSPGVWHTAHPSVFLPSAVFPT